MTGQVCKVTSGMCIQISLQLLWILIMNLKMIQSECCFPAKKEGEVLQDDEGCMSPEADPLPTTDRSFFVC